MSAAPKQPSRVSRSGTTFARPAFTEIMELAEKGMIGTLIVKDHSRLGRNRLVVGNVDSH